MKAADTVRDPCWQCPDREGPSRGCPSSAFWDLALLPVAEACLFEVQLPLDAAAGRIADLAVGVQPGELVALAISRPRRSPV